MKIAVVAYEMEGARTGVGRYLEGLLSGIAGLENDWRWLLFFKGDPFDHPLWTARRPAGGPAFEPIFDRRSASRPILWEQLRLPRLLGWAGADVLFSPAYSLPPAGGLPSLVTVHDLSFEHLPGEFPWKERWRRRLLARRAVRRARRVLADTREIARDLERTYGIDRGRIGVVPLALDPSFLEDEPPAAGDDERVLRSLGVRSPYLLQVGSILERRRADLVIAAFSNLAAREPELRLVLAGANRLLRPRRLERWIDASGCGERITVLGYVGEDVLRALYRRAALTFSVSSYEGYGLPPLESLASGTPAVVSRGLALDDLWPEYPYCCERLDRALVTATAEKALAETEGWRDLITEARRRLARLTWKRSAELFVAEIERALAS
jgi:glycosyltransferase involved in cell wall biosynthesis